MFTRVLLLPNFNWYQNLSEPGTIVGPQSEEEVKKKNCCCVPDGEYKLPTTETHAQSTHSLLNRVRQLTTKTAVRVRE